MNKNALLMLLLSIVLFCSCSEVSNYDNSTNVSYHVLYDGNGNAQGDIPEDLKDYSAGEIVTVQGNSGGLLASNDPYVIFAGWNTSPDGSGTHYAQGDSFEIKAPTVLYAEYDVVSSHRGMVSVPGGTFNQKKTAGSPDNFNHTVSGYKMGKYEVTYELWYAVYQWAVANGYYFANRGREGDNGTIGAAPTESKYEPVTNVNWRDAIVWCNAYSTMMGLTPVYYSNSLFTTVLKDSRDGSYGSSINSNEGSFDNPYVRWDADGFRLPTEGEWQYAASWKGENSSDGASEFPTGSGLYWTPYNFGSGGTGSFVSESESRPLFDPVAWSVSNTSKTMETGILLPNASGIFDMSGNVVELCWDWYSAAYPGASTDYRGPSGGTLRVRRGGGWCHNVELTQIGYIDSRNPYYEVNVMGFRVARSE